MRRIAILTLMVTISIAHGAFAPSIVFAGGTALRPLPVTVTGTVARVDWPAAEVDLRDGRTVTTTETTSVVLADGRSVPFGILVLGREVLQTGQTVVVEGRALAGKIIEADRILIKSGG